MEPLGFPEDHVYPNNAGVRAFRTHRSDLLEAFTNQKVSFEFAALLSDETRKIISGLKRTKQKVSEFLDEIEISLRLHMTFHWFVENLRKENTENSSVQQLCDELLSTCASMTGPDMMLPIPIIPSGPVDLSRVPDGTLDSSHLSVLVTALSRVHRHWLPLGIYLGVNDSTLIEIHRRNQKGNDETRGSEMLAMWLQGPKKKRNKQFLQSCLQRPLIPPWSSAPSTSTACGDEVPTRKKQEKARKFSVRADYDDEALPRRKFEKHSKQAACKDEVPSKKKQKRGSKQGHLPRELTRCTAEVIRKGAQVTCKVTSELSRPQSPVGRIVSREIPIEVTVRMDQSQTNELVLQKYKQHVNRYYKDTRVQFTNVTNSHEQLDHDEQSSSVINSMQAFVTINNEGFPEDHVYPNNGGVRAFRTHYDELLEAFTNQKVSFKFAALLSDETRKMILGLKRTKQKVSELLDEIEISLRLNMTFHCFVENLRKENEDNSSVQQLCDKLLSTCARISQGPDLMLPVSTVPSGPVDLSRVADGTLDSSHLSVLVTALSRVHHQWLPLGIYLGLSDSTLIEIFIRNQKGNDETRVSEMLAMWLQGPKKKRNKKFLQTCLRRPLTPPWSSAPSAPNTSNPREYICQVFYKQDGINSWIAVFSFFPKDFLEEVKNHYFAQYTEVGPTVDLQLKSKQIKILSTGKVNGWSCEFSDHDHQVSRKDVEQYTGVGKPPYCEMTLRADADGSTPPDLAVPVTLTGVKTPTTIMLEREARDIWKELSPSSEHERDYIDPNVAKTSLGVTVTMEITNVGTQGYPGVGKTSVLHLAIGKEPAPTRTSTDCVDPPSRYLMIDSATEGVEWEKVTTNKMFELVCEAMKKTIEDNPPDIAESDNSTAAIASQSTSGKEHELPSQASSIPSLPQASNVPSLTESAPSPDVSSHSGFTVFPELLKELSTSDNSGVIFNSHWMMVTDCGGQPPFLDAAALFLRNSCLQIFPVKLNEPLSKRPEFSYFNEGVQFSFDEDFVPLTHKQILETLAKSVASIQPPYTPSATKCPKGAKFTIVGTFEDKAHECSETVEEKESILKEILQPYEPFQVQLCKKVILPINAAAIDTESKKERTESAKKLRRLFKKANVSMKVDVKLRWFGFLLSLLTIAEKEHKAVLTLDECYKFGETLGMDESETKRAIQFFHDISLIMHFDTPKLRDSVIIDTKPVLNKLSRLISVSFLDENFLADHYDIELPSGAKELLQYHGRFSRDTLEKCVQLTEPISLQFFLDILEHVKIAVAIDKESEYFMPCALSYTPEASVSNSSPPWVIRLRVRRGVKDVYIPVPVGYLPAVVVFLLTEFSLHFSTDRCKRQYRKTIKLRYKRGGYVYLIERHLQLEIYFSVCEQLPQDCAAIRDYVLESIRLTEEKLHIIQEGEGAITKVDSFLCSCGKGSAHHTCAYNPLSGILECTESEETGERCKLDPQHSLWLESSKPGATIHQLSVTEQKQEATFEDELPPPRKKHKRAPPEATSEIVPEFSHTNSTCGTTQQELGTQEKQVCSECSNTLGIDKLVEVKDTLKKVNDWQSLGLQLGLLYPTLEQIETDNRGIVERCKTKMIAAWLKRQDNVLKVGVPSWSVLKAALRKIGEGEVADQIVT